MWQIRPYSLVGHDPTNQAVQVVFTRKSKQIDHPKIYFNDIEVKSVNDHKHLGLILDSKALFYFSYNIKNIESSQRTRYHQISFPFLVG